MNDEIKSIFLNKKGEAKIRKTKANREILTAIIEAKKIFKEKGEDVMFNYSCLNEVDPNGKKKINLRFENNYLNFLEKNEILLKIKRINVELYAIKQAFDYMGQYLYLRKLNSLMNIGIFRYLFNMCSYYTHIRLRSLLDWPTQPDDATITLMMWHMSHFLNGINVKHYKKQSSIPKKYNIDTQALYSSYLNVIGNKKINQLKTLVNKYYKHITTLLHNDYEPMFIKISKDDIQNIKILYELYDLIHNYVFKSIVSFFIPGNNCATFPQFSKPKIIKCNSDICGIFSKIPQFNSFNNVVKVINKGIDSLKKEKSLNRHIKNTQ